MQYPNCRSFTCKSYICFFRRKKACLFERHIMIGFFSENENCDQQKLSFPLITNHITIAISAKNNPEHDLPYCSALLRSAVYEAFVKINSQTERQTLRDQIQMQKKKSPLFTEHQQKWRGICSPTCFCKSFHASGQFFLSV